MLDRRAVEEVGVHEPVQSDRVVAREITELVVVEMPVVDELVRLGEHVEHVRHVPVTEVGAEDGAQTCTARVHVLRVGPPDGGIVGLAAEVEVVEVPTDVRSRRDTARAVVVDLDRRVVALCGHGLAHPGVGEACAAVLVEDAVPFVEVEMPGVEAVDVLAAAFRESIDEVAQQLHAPRDSTFEEREVQRGEAVRDPTEEHGLRERVPGGAEVPNVVEHVARRRRAQSVTLRARVHGDRDSEVDAARPQRVVVMVAVEREEVAACNSPATIGRTQDEVVEHHRPKAQLLHRVVELGDGLVGSVRGHDGRCRHQVLVSVGYVGQVVVQATARSGTDGGVRMADARQAHTGVEHREVDADLVESLGEQTGEEAGGAIAGVGG